MPVIPPWLDVKPSDFVAAQIAGAKIAAENDRTSQAAQAREAISGARIGAANQIAQERIAAAQQAREQEDARRRWELAQRMQMQQQGQESTERFRQGTLSLRDAQNQIAQERAETERMRAEGAGGAGKMAPLDTHLLNDALIRRREAQTEAQKALDSISSGGKIPEEVQKRINSAQSDIDSLSKKYMQPFTAGTGTQTSLPEGARVRNKQTGQMGTVQNGVIVPDQAAPEQPAGQISPVFNITGRTTGSGDSSGAGTFFGTPQEYEDINTPAQ
jgi:hypothetical protein